MSKQTYEKPIGFHLVKVNGVAAKGKALQERWAGSYPAAPSTAPARASRSKWNENSAHSAK